MKTKTQNLIGFISMVLVLCILGLVAVIGVGDYGGVFADGGVTLGLDLVGGTRLVYSPDAENVTEEQMSTVRSMLRARLDFYGYTEATITTDENGRFIIEIPQVTSSEAESLLSATARLTFEIFDGTDYTVVMEGSAVESAAASYGNTGNGYDDYFVSLKLKNEYQSVFRDATEQALALKSKGYNKIYIRLDGKTYSEPSVSEVLDTDTVMISGSFTAETATALAGVISSGQLPFALKVEQSDSVDATLGATALRSSLIAGLIGLILVMAFMIVFYRLPGLVASIALAGYTVCMGLAISLMHVNLSLAGIAGIILSIGMAVDANVIIFERIKEELALGKSTQSAFHAGFSKAFTAILDSNITTIIAVVVLYFFGTGTIQGFAITLGLGVIFSMIFAVVVTRFLLKRLVGMKVNNVKAWGLSAKKEGGLFAKLGRFSYIKSRRAILITVAVVLVIGLGSFFIRGFNPDVEFTGGTTMQVDLSELLAARGEDAISESLMNEIAATVNGTVDADGASVGASVSSTQRANGNQLMIKMSVLSQEQRNLVFGNLKNVYSLNDSALISSSNIGATVSSEIRRDAVVAAIIAVILMLIYITIRFDLHSGLAAVICLVHDVFVMIIAYSLFQIPLNGTMIAAMLTILGYSINATIVIFDRIRENKIKLSKTDFDGVVDASIHQTFLRSLNTTITTFLTILMLCILGVTSIRQFALPLLVGVIAGFFSSVFLSGNLWCFFNKIIRFGKKNQKTEEQ